MAGLDWLFVVIVIVFVIIRKIAEASRSGQQGPGSKTPRSRPDGIDISVDDIEEFLGRRRQAGPSPAGSPSAGSAPARERPAFPGMGEEDEELQEMPDVFARPGTSPPQVGASRPAPQGAAAYPTFLGPDRGGASRPARPPQARPTPSTGQRERRPARAEAARGGAKPKRSHRAAKPGETSTYESPIRLPKGLTPIQQAMVFAQIFGKPGGKYGNL